LINFVSYKYSCSQSMEFNNNPDTWTYIWGSEIFSSKKCYSHLIGSQPVHPSFKWLWKSHCQAKHRVFFWLLHQNRHNTRGLLRRKNMALESYTCHLCILQKEEKLRHLFYRCPFAKQCWLQIGIIVTTWLKPDRATRYIKRKLNSSFAMEIIILMCWSIWTKRNRWVFDNLDPMVPNCKETFKREFALLFHRVKEDQAHAMKLWLSALS
jgi:hypothetical protein